MGRATSSIYRLSFRRVREGRTNYKHRLALVKSGKPRLVVRKTDRYVIAQLVEFDAPGDKVILSVHSKRFAKMFPSLKNLPVAYLTGYALAKQAIEKGYKEAVLDLGRRTPTKSMFAYAALKGALDAGMEIPHNPEIFDESRFKGEHIANYAKQLKESDEAAYKRQFSKYLEMGIDPQKLPELLDKALKSL